MSEMVERVASAIENSVQVWVVGVPEGESRAPNYVEMARAAIEAMREPTNRMNQEGDAAIDGIPIAAEHVWRAMIDAAL